MIDKKYCMSAFLQYRTIPNHSKCFSEKYPTSFFRNNIVREPVFDSIELENVLREQVEAATVGGRTALALSGGIDSAILAKFMPKDSTVYTFKCIVPGIEVIDETPAAARYAKACGLKQKIVEVYWEDFLKYSPILMKHKGAPIHSIEVQIYKAALQAKADGFDRIIFGESADLNYGGLSGLLSKDWTVGDFIERYSYVLPFKVLRDPILVTSSITDYEEDGYVNVHEFNRFPFYTEAMGSYTNACETADIQLSTPYAHTFMGAKLDIDRIRRGDGKYLVREVFKRLYQEFEIRDKLPMPRPMNEWFKGWSGPIRPEFWSHSTDNMTGDQKWLVYALERFLNIIEGEE